MICMLHYINFFLYLMLFILRITFCSNILLLLSALTLPTFVMIVFLSVFVQRLKFSKQTSDLSRHYVLANSLRFI